MANILDISSLGATLWNLEEARLAGARPDDREVADALEWVVSRKGIPGAYGPLCAPTNRDLVENRPAPTGEGSGGRAGVKHILGEEAVRALTLWDAQGWGREPVFAWILQAEHPRRSGMFCCAACSVARWRALSAARPIGWERVVGDGIAQIRATDVSQNGRRSYWKFFYTLLALTDVAELPEARAEIGRVRPVVDRLLKRPVGEDSASRFRHLALERAAAL